LDAELFPQIPCSSLDFEQRARRQGYHVVAGVDEAGRGPLAGPVVSAAVILPEDVDLDGLTDSKLLSPAARNEYFRLIGEQAVAVGIGVSRHEEIDRINILQATLCSMVRAVGRLRMPPDYLLIDGITPVPIAISQQTIKQGDLHSLSISAASVVAKVIRDRIMFAYDRVCPGYGFASHKGYSCASHKEAIARLGPSLCHRRSFNGVKEHCHES